MHGTSTLNLPNKIGNARGALKVDGLDQFNPSDNVILGSKQSKKKKEGKSCSC